MTFDTPLLEEREEVDLKTLQNVNDDANSSLTDTIATFSFDANVDQGPINTATRNALITNAFIGLLVGGICAYIQFELTNSLDVDGFEDFSNDENNDYGARLTIFWSILIGSNLIIAIFEIIVIYLANAHFFMKLCEVMGPGISKSELLHENLLRIAFNLDFKKSRDSMGRDPDRKVRKCNLCMAGILYRVKVQVTVIIVRLTLIFSLHRSDVSKHSMWVAIPMMTFWDFMLGWKTMTRAKAVISSPRLVNRFLLSLHEFYQNEYCAEHNIDDYCKIELNVLYPSEFRDLLINSFAFFPLTGRKEVTEEVFVRQMKHIYGVNFPSKPADISWSDHLQNLAYHKNKHEVLLAMKIVSINLIMRPFISSHKLTRYREACMSAHLWVDDLGFGPLQRIFDIFRNGKCTELDLLYLFDRHYQQQYSDSCWRSCMSCCESFFYKYTF